MTEQRRASTYLLRQMIRADVDGSAAAAVAAFFAAGGGGVAVGVGVDADVVDVGAGLEVSAEETAGASAWAPFFLRAMS